MILARNHDEYRITQAYYRARARGPRRLVALDSWGDPGSPARRLSGQGLLQSLAGVAVDAAYLRSVLDTIEGPVNLVSHAYGGAVITQTGDDPKGRALIYAGSPMPGVGESANDCLVRFPGGDFASSVELTPYTLPDGSSGTNVHVKSDKYPHLFVS